MNYIELYKNRLSRRGGNYHEALTNSNKDYYNRHFLEDPSARSGSLILQPNIEYIDQDFRLKNIDNSCTDKRIIFRPDTEVYPGDYVKISDREYYLIEEVQKNQLCPVGIGTLCTKILRWEGLPNDILLPCTAKTNSYGSKGLLNTVDQQSDYDSRGIIKVQKNKYTESIQNGMRFVFGNSIREIYEVSIVQSIFSTNDFDDGKGFLELVCRYTRANKEDNIDNNKAYNKYGDDIIKNNPDLYDVELITDGYISTKENKVIKLSKELDNVTFEIDDINVATIVEATNKSCTIKGVRPNNVVNLVVRSNGEIIIAKKLLVVSR